MKWFGKRQGAPYEDYTPITETPKGSTCVRCDEVIEAGDDGFIVPHIGIGQELEEHAYHYECHLRAVLGGLNHQLGICTCCGGSEPPDPPELSKRDAARAALEAWQGRKMRRATL